jgi:AraC-like DNA-binding protein
MPSACHFATTAFADEKEPSSLGMNQYQRQFILGLLAYAAQRDLDITRLCALSGIDLSQLLEPSSTISSKQHNDLWINACHLSNDPLFGLHFGESLQLAALGVVGEIIKSSATVAEAVSQAAGLASLVTDLFSMEVEEAKTSFTISYRPRPSELSDFTRKQMTDAIMVFTVHELDGLLLTKVKPERVYIPFDEKDEAEFERVFRCSPTRKKSEFALTFSKQYLSQPIITANYELQKTLLEKVHQSAPPTLQGSATWKDKVFHYIMSHGYLNILSLEEVAANFNMSGRTLQRKLQDEGVSFQQVADGVKKSLAIHYMQSGNYQIKEISIMLGYNELSAFSRAFKRWTGKAPVAYQA